MILKKRSTNLKIVPINWMRIAKNWSKNSIILQKRNKIMIIEIIIYYYLYTITIGVFGPH